MAASSNPVSTGVLPRVGFFFPSCLLVLFEPKFPLMTIKEIRTLLGRVSCGLLGNEFTLLVEYDKKYTRFRGGVQPPEGRIYLQVQYQAPCTKTGVHGTWKGGKYYLSSHMTPDEIVKKAYVAFEAAVKHEIMEGFKVDGKILFNPHVNFEELLEVSNREVKREEPNMAMNAEGKWIKHPPEVEEIRPNIVINTARLRLDQMRECSHFYQQSRYTSVFGPQEVCLYCGHRR